MKRVIGKVLEWQGNRGIIVADGTEKDSAGRLVGDARLLVRKYNMEPHPDDCPIEMGEEVAFLWCHEKNRMLATDVVRLRWTTTRGAPHPASGEMESLKAHPSAFISYAKEDREAARRIHQALEKAGISTWFDEAKLVPGDEWEPEIEKAIQAADFGVPCLAANSVAKIGFFQAELKKLMSRQERHPSGAASIIPVRLDDSAVPGEFRKYQWLDLFPDFERGAIELCEATRAQWTRRKGG